MTVVVTGGLGFIGKHLVEVLSSKGKDVLIIDRKIGKSVNNSRIKILNIDIRNRDKLEEIEKKDVEEVYHLAAKVSVPESFEKPVEYFNINTVGSSNIFETFKDSKILYVSSAAVYGHCKKLPIKETYELSPLSPYGLSKMLAEESAKEYIRLYGSNITIVRPFNVYGPGQKNNQYAGVVSIFLEQWKKGKALTVRGDGNQVRDFVHVKDVCEAMIKVMGKKDVFNVASGKKTRIIDLARMISDKIKFVPEISGEIKYSWADIKKIKRTGWRPKIPLKKGIEELKELHV
ncbi:hypothetical protein DRN74_02185 [Candidatus Micrarchaeota archaeon]|nr:MAG: hypothetical protein DRN74_02185 [Candidatus Micrarchaeota archaeon]